MDFKKTMKEVGAVGIHFEEMMLELRIKAMTDFPILITGETGTGKELVAKLIHKMSKRSDKPLQFVNVPAINNGVFESELFGHEKGSFTDASKSRKGLLRECDGGTIVLDEIGDMSLGVQAKILRWLENREIKAVGSDRTTFVDVRIIASTNQNLEVLIERGVFRRDLYYRLNALPIELLPLRKNKEAILDLAKYFVDKNKGHFFDCYGNSVDEPSGSELANLFSELVEGCAFRSNFLHGNTRELESMVREWLFQRAYNRSEEKILSISHYPTFVDKKPDDSDGSKSEKNKPEESEEHKRAVEKNNHPSIGDLAVENIRNALIFCKGNTSNTAKLLECSEEFLLDIMQVHNISFSEDDFRIIIKSTIKPLESLLREHRTRKGDNKHHHGNWLDNIICNFTNPSQVELVKIGELLDEKVKKIEKETIQMALDYCKGNLSKTSKSLSMNAKKLEEKMKEYDIVSVFGNQPTEPNPGPLRTVLICTKNELISFLLKKGMSVKDIADIFGCDISTVYQRIRRYNLKGE